MASRRTTGLVFLLTFFWTLSAFGRGRGRLEWPGRFEYYVKQLHAHSIPKRMAALQVMATYPLARTERHLLPLLTDDVWSIRESAAALLVSKKSIVVEGYLVRWLEDIDPTHRVAALRLLARTGSKQATWAAIRALRDFDPMVRVEAILAIEHLGVRNAVAPILSALDDEDAKVRAAAARALGKSRDPRAVIALIGKMSDQVSDVRQQAVRSLGQLADPKATSAVLRRLNDRSREVRRAAITALGNLKTKESVITLIRIFKTSTKADIRKAAAMALSTIGTAACAEAIASQLANPSSSILNMASERLAAMGAVAVPVLVSMLSNSNTPRKTQRVIVTILGHIGSRTASHVLVQVLRRDTVPTSAVLAALRTCADPRAAMDLVRFAVNTNSARLQEQALDAAAHAGASNALGPMLQILLKRAHTKNVKVTAIRLLGQTRTLSAVPMLRKLAKHEKGPLQVAAVNALGALHDQDSVPILEQIMETADSQLRLAATNALVACLSPQLAQNLLNHLTATTPLPAQVAYVALAGLMARRFPTKVSLPRLVELARSTNRKLALAAVEALGASHQSSAKAALIHMLARGSKGIRAKALESLTAFSAPEIRPMLSKWIEGDDLHLAAAAAWDMGKVVGSAGRPAILRALSQKTPLSLRINLSAALARIAVQADRRRLLSMLTDTSPYVVINALWGLVRLKILGLQIQVDEASIRDKLTIAPVIRPYGERLLARLTGHQVRGSTQRPTLANHADARNDWVAIHVRNAKGSATPNRFYVLVLPQGLAKAGWTDQVGQVREERIPTGDCQIVFPKQPRE
ncbi:MAG: HEAT repeat domain-containing protein [Deltaproteobacteria bacterium]|nr:HEAT repeat domain-containing protein [Deltaproteobacteria bacterium]